MLPTALLTLATIQVVTVQDYVASAAPDIQVSPSIRQDRIFVDPHGSSPINVLRGVAKALGASLVTEKGVTTLERTANDKAGLATSVANYRLKWINDALTRIASFQVDSKTNGSPLDAFLSELRRQAKQSTDYRAGEAPSSDQLYASYLLPPTHLLQGIISTLGARTFATIPSGDTQVFSTIPRFAEKSLPHFADLISQYEELMAPFQTAALSDQNKRDMNDMNLRREVGWWAKREPVVALRLIVRSTESQVIFQLLGYDHNGNSALDTTLVASPLFGGYSDKELLGLYPPKDHQDLWPLSEDSLEAVRFMQSDSPCATFPEWFVHPERTDPDNTYVREWMEALASRSRQDRPFISVVSDDMFTEAYHYVVGDALVLTALDADLNEWLSYEQLDDKDLTIWRPRDIPFEEKKLVNRSVLAKDFSELQHGSSDFHSYCVELAEASKEPSEMSRVWFTSAPFKLGSLPINGSHSSLSGRLCMALGKMSELSWSELLSGRTMKVSQTGVVDLLVAWLHQSFDVVPGEGLSDWEKYPICSLGRADIDNQTISMPMVVAKEYRMWQTKNPEPLGGRPIAEIWHQYSLIPQDSAPVDGRMVVTLTRQAFEARNEEDVFRFLEAKQYPFQMSIPGGSLAELVSEPPAPTSTVIPYAGLPDATREQIWRRASGGVH